MCVWLSSLTAISFPKPSRKRLCHPVFVFVSVTFPSAPRDQTSEKRVMADNTQGSSFWEGYKHFWSERFAFLGNYSRFIKHDKPIPSWSSSDVEEFIASDPVHGPVLKTAREAVQYGLAGSALGAVYTAGFAWKYSKSLHGAALSFLAGGVFGWTFGHEIANHALQLYRVDTLAAETKFLEWWKNKSEGGY